MSFSRRGACVRRHERRRPRIHSIRVRRLPGAREVRSMATVVPKTEVRHYQMYIDGRWTDAASGETYDVVDPASEEVIARVPKGGVADAEAGGPRGP